MLRTLIATGDPVVAQNLQLVFKSFMRPGVVQGFNLYVVNNNTLGITPGAAFTDSGVFILEDETKTISIDQTVASKDYTVIYKYAVSNDFGGGTASLQLVNGLLSEATFSEGVIIGWVKYSGGSLPLNTDMLFSATKINLSKPIQAQKGSFNSVLAPLDSKWVQKSVSGVGVTVSSFYSGVDKSIVTQVSNSAATLKTAEYLIPFEVPALGVGQLMCEFSVTTAAGLIFDILTQSGTVVVPPTNVPIYTNKTMGQVILPVPKDQDLVPGKLMYVRLNISLQPTNNITIKRVGISSYTEPV